MHLPQLERGWDYLNNFKRSLWDSYRLTVLLLDYHSFIQDIIIKYNQDIRQCVWQKNIAANKKGTVPVFMGARISSPTSVFLPIKLFHFYEALLWTTLLFTGGGFFHSCYCPAYNSLIIFTTVYSPGMSIPLLETLQRCKQGPCLMHLYALIN